LLEGKRSKAGVTLVLGGTRSGKSEVAEGLAISRANGLPVTYVATAGPLGSGLDASGKDASFWLRIEKHRQRRPPEWATNELEHPEALPALLGELEGLALVDSLGAWVARSNHMEVDVDALVRSLLSRAARGMPSVLVSEEVGLGVHPATEPGLRFADALGVLNREVARVAEEVLLVVAGRVLELVDARVR
jgi:adenosyl cobinamide kinase/adenosyl cobinamide phosphate guanylyltransferase